ncbi:hypothetical protein FHW69_001245 [Luteibacter sp. Sphag1AF]|uniref:hypothetical protein n=1 Tax=Luteibacter sp. Sphag1AF TaxID=2587031 RepID=UPI00160E924B|nr:hypothetical protein [Luteibacter sp. Sphag1AF]MBB3226655.1 hypothetical protein [Luteibacter sp. Sphag1AF]
MKRVLFFILFFLSFDAVALGPQKSCFRTGADREGICSVSLTTLITRGEEFDGKIVMVTGYFAYAEYPMIFVSKEAFLSSDAASGVGIVLPESSALARKLTNSDHQIVEIVGRYHAVAEDVSAFGALRTGGKISEITSAGPTEAMPWGYSLPVPYGVEKKAHSGGAETP